MKQIGIPLQKQRNATTGKVHILDPLPHEKQIQEYINTIEHLKKQNQNNPIFHTEIRKLEQKLEKLKQNVYAELTPWQRILICRHPQRPHTLDYCLSMCDKFT